MQAGFIYLANAATTLDIERIKTRLVYFFDENSGAAKPSRLQIIRNCTGAVKKLGGKIVYEGESEHYYYRGATCRLTIRGITCKIVLVR